MKPDLKTILQKTFLLSVLLFVAAATQGAWAVQLKYHIVNKSGLTPVYEIRQHTNDGENLLIPKELISPYIQEGGYKYFKTPDAAQEYILNGTIAGEVTTYTSDLSEVYVGYYYDADYTPEGMPKLVRTYEEAVRYHIQIGRHCVFLEYKTNSNYQTNPKVENGSNMVVTDTASAIMQFTFISDNIDPYDIKIVSPFYPDGWMHSEGNALNNKDKFCMWTEPSRAGEA